jgi:hypothetical protein
VPVESCAGVRIIHVRVYAGKDDSNYLLFQNGGSGSCTFIKILIRKFVVPPAEIQMNLLSRNLHQTSCLQLHAGAGLE